MFCLSLNALPVSNFVDPLPKDMALLGGVLGRENLQSGMEGVVGNYLRRGAITGVCIWVFLLVTMIVVAPLSSYQYMNGPEQMANATLLALLIGVNFNRVGPLLVNGRN